MTRVAALLAFVLCVAGCAGGEDGVRAQEILERAMAAAAEVESATFEGELAIRADDFDMRATMRGGGYLRGERAGDLFVTMEMAPVPGFPGGRVDVVMRRGSLIVGTNGRWQRMELPAEARAAATPSFGPGALSELARHVKEVRLNEQQVVNGEPVATIAGEIDTAGLLASMSSLMSVPDGVGSLPDVSELADAFGDTEVLLVVSKRTSLITAARIGFTIEMDGKSGEIELSYRLTSANVPVAFPKTI